MAEETMNTEFLALATPVILTTGFIAVAILLLHCFMAQGSGR